MALFSCNEKTRTITPHKFTNADSGKTMIIKSNVAQLQMIIEVSNRQANFLIHKKLDSATCASIDSIGRCMNTLLIQTVPVNDTTYTN